MSEDNEADAEAMAETKVCGKLCMQGTIKIKGRDVSPACSKTCAKPAGHDDKGEPDRECDCLTGSHT